MMPLILPLRRFALAIVAPVAIGMVGFVNAAHAVPITYTFSGTGEFFFDNVTYTDQLVTFTVAADTDGIGLSLPGTHADDLGRVGPYNPGVTTVTVGAVTDVLADFPESADVFGSRTSVSNATAGIPQTGGVPLVVLLGGSGIGIIGVVNEAFATFNLANPFGPITTAGGATALSEDPEEAFNKTLLGGPGGLFYWITVPTKATFSAVTAPVVTPVPEPSSLALLGIGLVAFAGRRLRQRAVHTATR
jgi:PEP-CTERM motif